MSFLSIGLMSGTSMDGIDASLMITNGVNMLKELASHQVEYSVQTKMLLKSAERAIYKADGDLNKARDIYFSELKNYLEIELKLKNINSNIDALQKYLLQLIKSESSLFECLDLSFSNSHQTLGQQHLNKHQVSADLMAEFSSTNILGYQIDAISLDSIILLSTLLHVKAVKQLLKISSHEPSDINVIGYHGQTMYHNPRKGLSIQVGDGDLLARLTRIDVINDFRSRDLSLGGQGSPFAPLYHQALAVRDDKLPIIFVNCGGIANITVINGKNYNDLQGFDTGPGNGLLDLFIKTRTKNQETMDLNGKYGSLGKVCHKTVEALFASSACLNGENFYKKLPPKSLDIRDLNLVAELDKLNINDGAATLAAFTVESIVASLYMLDNVPERWVVAGGGFRNPVIFNMLKLKLLEFYKKSVSIETASYYGWNSQSLEAQIFAYFAVRSLLDLPLSVPGTTGVLYSVSGGTKHSYCSFN